MRKHGVAAKLKNAKDERDKKAGCVNSYLYQLVPLLIYNCSHIHVDDESDEELASVKKKVSSSTKRKHRVM